METRRFIMALSLSLLVFVAYMRFFAPTPPEKPVLPETGSQEEAQKKPVRMEPFHATAMVENIEQADKGRDIIVETDLVKATLNTAGGVITGWELKQYREADKTPVGLVAMYKKITGQAPKVKVQKKELGNVQLLPVYAGIERRDMIAPLTIIPLDQDLNKLSRVEYRSNRDAVLLDTGKSSETLVLTYNGPAGLKIEKRLTFHNDTYRVDIEVNTRRLDGYTLLLGTDFGLADKVSSDSRGRVGLVAQVDGKTITEELGDIEGEIQHSGEINWFGQSDKYFTATIVSGSPGLVTGKRTVAPKEVGDLLTTALTVKEKTEAHTFLLYAGPKSYTLLQAENRSLEQMVDYGWFGVLAKPMFWLMKQFYDLTRNYGIAIILLTIVVRIILFYPSLKSAMSMEEMKKIQPQIMALREKHKKDPSKMNTEMMKLYKEHKVNPVGGCLPMVLQLPFFIALYNVLSVSIELRQAPFISFWIKDLSVYDPFYILPVLMGASMILTMKMTAAMPDPKQAKMMMYMNVAFIFLFAWLPAGLLLYICLSNVLSIGQQLYVRKLINASASSSVASS
jgi:YidC/Oxa1 family membrane protein insertase